ncbi:MAG: lactate racemase domain-containing protein [Pirellulales bacterium]
MPSETHPTDRSPLRLDRLGAAQRHTLPRGQRATDVAATVLEALAAPLDFPPLAAAVLPGDSVAIAVDPLLPQLSLVVATLVRSLVDDGADASRITVALDAATDDATQEAIRQALPSAWADDVVLAVHDPDNQDALAYLGDTRAHRRVDLCRALFDADVLVSLGRFTPTESFQSLGVHTALYPTFAATAVQRRYRRLATVGAPRRYLRQARNELDEVARLAGAMFTVQVIPGSGDDVLHVLAGAPGAVAKAARQCCREAWTAELAAPVELVVATVSPQANARCWDELARALTTAARAATPDGALAVCCTLDTPPGAGVAQLAASDNRDRAVAQIRHDAPVDTAVAMQLAHVLARHDVYMLSGLDAETLEDLGVTPLTGADDLARLAGRFADAVVIENAHLAVVRIAD